VTTAGYNAVAAWREEAKWGATVASAGQNDVFFCPGVDLTTMGAGEFWCLDFGCGPELFFDGLSGRREFRSGRTPHEQPFNDRSVSYFPWRSGCEKFHLNLFLCEPINDASLVDIVRRHFEFHAVTNRKANKTFAHFPRNMREHEVFVRQRDAKHCAWKNGQDCPFHLDSFF
jgi:hypothetical protein